MTSLLARSSRENTPNSEKYRVFAMRHAIQPFLWFDLAGRVPIPFHRYLPVAGLSDTATLTSSNRLDGL